MRKARSNRVSTASSWKRINILMISSSPRSWFSCLVLTEVLCFPWEAYSEASVHLLRWLEVWHGYIWEVQYLSPVPELRRLPEGIHSMVWLVKLGTSGARGILPLLCAEVHVCPPFQKKLRCS